MHPETEAEARASLAHWFVTHDDIDEAARLLKPGDELPVGRSDYAALAAALARRGLAAAYDDGRRVAVVREALATAARRPAARAANPAAATATAAKKHTA